VRQHHGAERPSWRGLSPQKARSCDGGAMSEERRLNEDWRPMIGNDWWLSEERRLCEYGPGSLGVCRHEVWDSASVATGPKTRCALCVVLRLDRHPCSSGSACATVGALRWGRKPTHQHIVGAHPNLISERRSKRARRGTLAQCS
jgi:hypothetical protein